MNTNQPQPEHPAQGTPPPQQEVRAEAARSVETEAARAALAPEAIAAADITKNDERARPDVEKPTRGVDWVRASDLLARGTGAISRRAIDLEAKLGYTTRHGIAVGAKYLGRKTGELARKLPPLSAFGREPEQVEPRGMGRA